MKKNKIINVTKKDIIINIQKKIGSSNQYIGVIVEDFLSILKNTIKKDDYLNIKNFGNFKTLSKSERLGRNPKTNEIFKINARKTLSFISSRTLNNKINDLNEID